MRRCLSLLLFVWVLAACALPFEMPSNQATATPAPARQPAPTAPTAAVARQPEAPASTPVSADPAPTSSAAAPSDLLDDPARIAAAPPEVRDQVALAEAFKGIGAIPDVARTTPLDVKVGDVETFWVNDFETNTNYQVRASLRYAGPIALMYVDTSLEVDEGALEQSALQFEQQIYPRDRALFGAEHSPGVDGDTRLTILNTTLRGGAAGYFSGADGVVRAVNRFSNERDMFVMGINSFPLGSDAYASTLAHEFQHMIEANVQRRSPLWINEGMSTLAEDLNGYVSQGVALEYLSDPDLQLTAWQPLQGAHYGASQLFLRYFQEQYAGEQGLSELIKADAGNNPEAFVPIAARKRPDIKRFADIYADWAVANALDDPAVDGGRYAYQLLPERAPLTPIRQAETTTVSQFGADYYGELEGPLAIDFDGADTVGLTATTPKAGRAMWWSNRGDDSIETLTRQVDLTGVRQATLRFSAWYEIELNFDYAFVSASTDGGQTWTTLKGTSTTDLDPQGHNFGNGITGISGAPGVETDKGTRGQWVDEQMDLTPFAGKRIMLRFWMVHDEGYNAPGLLLDNIQIPEIDFSDGAESDDGWQASGFMRTTGELAQTWALRLIRIKGGATTVEQPAVDSQGRAHVQLGAGERGILVVIGTTPFTTEPAAYSYTLSAP